MNRTTALQRHDGAHFVVPMPRAYDGIGQALRGAFDGGAALPIDMVVVLERLNRSDARAHRLSRRD